MKNRLPSMLRYAGIFFCSLAHSDGIVTANIQTQWRPVVGVGGGIASTGNLGQQLIFPIINPITDENYNYSPNNQVQTQGLFEVFLGAEHSIYQNWLIQAGLAYSQTGSYHSKGTFVQGADPASSNQYTYRYGVTARELLAQAKFMYPYHEKFYPYFLLGLGGSFNEASHYSTNVPPFLTFTRDYANNTSNSFAYKLGLGADMDITHHARIGVAYRFSGLGAVGLGAANIDGIAVSGTLSQSNLYANEVLIQLTYVT